MQYQVFKLSFFSVPGMDNVDWDTLQNYPNYPPASETYDLLRSGRRSPIQLLAPTLVNLRFYSSLSITRLQ